MQSVSPITVVPGAFDFINMMPQKLELKGSGVLFLYFCKQRKDNAWGNQQFPHLNAKVIHPNQLHPSKLGRIWKENRVIVLSVNNGQMNAISTMQEVQSNASLPIMLVWKKTDCVAKKEFYALNANLCYMPVPNFQQQFGSQFEGLKRTYHATASLSIPVDASSLYLQIYRCCKPGDVLSTDFVVDEYGKLKFQLYRPLASDNCSCIRFYPEFKLNQKNVNSDPISSGQEFCFPDISLNSLNKLDSHFRIGYLTVFITAALYKAAINKTDPDFDFMDTRAAIINGLKAVENPGIIFFGADGKKCDFASAVRYGFAFDDVKIFNLKQHKGRLSLREMVKRARFTPDGMDKDCILSPGAHQLLSFYELEKKLMNSPNAPQDNKKTRFTSFSFAQKPLYPRFDESYVDFCHCSIEKDLLTLSGKPFGYFDVFASSSALPELNAMYSNNISEKAASEFKGGLRSLFKGSIGGDSSSEPEFLKEVITRYLSGKGNREDCLTILRNLKDVYQYLKIICAEISFRLDNISAVGKVGAKTSELQDRFTKAYVFVRKIEQEFARTNI